MDNDTTPVTRDLTARAIPFRFFHHPGPVNSLEQAALERGQDQSQVIRSILFRMPDNVFVMVLIAGPSQISWKALRQHLGTSRMTMATDEEVAAVTGYLPGSVSPFGLTTPVRLLIDENVFKNAEVSLGSGVRSTTVILKSQALRQAFPDAEVGSFCNEC